MSELAPGESAPQTVLPRLDGRDMQVPGSAPLSFLVFLKASCPTCRWAAPFVQRLHERASSLSVIGVASDTPEDARTLARELSLTFPIAVEGEPWEISAVYGLQVVPTVFLVDRQGKVILSSAGFVKQDFETVAHHAAREAGEETWDLFPEGEAVPPMRPG